LTLLLEALAPHWPSLIDDVRHGTIRPPQPLSARLEQQLRRSLRPRPRRAAELAALAPDRITAIWPRLGLISGWGNAHARTQLSAIERMIPGVPIQPKGLLATEAVVTIPFDGRTPLAIRSPLFEFFPDGCSSVPPTPP